MALRSPRFTLVVLSFAVVALASASGMASAQEAPTAATQAEARRLFDEGRAHADAERWPAAVTSFESSRALLERPSTVFNLASALVRVGRSLDALDALDALERIADPRRDRVMLEGVPDLRARAESSILHVVVNVSPEAALLEVDGEPVEGTGPRRALTLDPGAHSASVSLPGFTTERVELGQAEIAVTLRPRLARVRIEPSLTSAAVSVDGTARGLGVVEVELEAGAHVLEVTAAGHEPLARQIEVEPGAELTVAADLVAIARPAESGTDVPLVVGLTLGGVILVAGVATILGVVFGSTTEAPSGGTTNIVIAVPLTGPALRF